MFEVFDVSGGDDQAVSGCSGGDKDVLDVNHVNWPRSERVVVTTANVRSDYGCRASMKIILFNQEELLGP